MHACMLMCSIALGPLPPQRRNFNGEDVAVDLHVNNQPAQEVAEEPNDEGEALSTVAFNVTVTKGTSALVFECESDGTYVSINHLSHEPKDGQPSESFYTVRIPDHAADRNPTSCRCPRTNLKPGIYRGRSLLSLMKCCTRSSGSTCRNAASR